MKLPTKKHISINLAIKPLLSYEFLTFLITSPPNHAISPRPLTEPGSAVKVTESNKSSSLAMRAMPSGTPTPKFTTHFGVNSLVVSKQSPTGPTERTPKPEYLMTLATYWTGSVGKVPLDFWWIVSRSDPPGKVSSIWDPSLGKLGKSSTQKIPPGEGICCFPGGFLFH